jgi:hypothetical protein
MTAGSGLSKVYLRKIKYEDNFLGDFVTSVCLHKLAKGV